MTRPAGRLIRYIVVGVVNTAVTYAAYLALLRVMSYSLAYSAAFVLGIGLAYVLQSRYVFDTPASLRTFFAFPLIYVGQYVVGVVALWLLVETGVMTRELAVFVVLLVTVPVGFVLSRALFAWRRRHGAH